MSHKYIETVGVLENPDGFLWLISLTRGHYVSTGIEDFEGKLVKLTRYEDKIILEVIHESEPIPVKTGPESVSLPIT